MAKEIPNLPTYNDKLFVERKELSEIMKKVEALCKGEHREKRVTAVIGERGVGKSWFLKRLHDEIKKIDGVKTAFLDLRDYRDSDPAEAVTAVLQKFSREFLGVTIEPTRNLAEMSRQIFEKIKKLVEEQILVLFVDHVYESDWKMLGGLEDYLLGPLAAERNNLIFLAGRGPIIPWITPELRENAFLRLQPFDLDQTKEQLRKQTQSEARAEKIYEISSGNPMGNYWLSLPNYEQQIDAILDTFLEEMMIPDRKSLRRNMEALCVLRSFEEERIMKMLEVYENESIPYGQAFKIRTQLVQATLAWWDQEKGAYLMNPMFRKIFEHYLEIKKPETWVRLHREAINLYTRWAVDYARVRDRWLEEKQYHEERLRQANIDPHRDSPSSLAGQSKITSIHNVG